MSFYGDAAHQSKKRFYSDSDVHLLWGNAKPERTCVTKQKPDYKWDSHSPL